MPTTRPRHTLTETPALAEALDDASRVWPTLRSDRSALLRKLIEAGHAAVTQEAKGRENAAALRALSGALTGVYPNDAAARLKAEWPE